MIYGDGTWNIVLSNQATLAPSSSFAKQQIDYTLGGQEDILDQNVDTRGGQTTVEELCDAPQEYPVDGIVHHIGECDKARHIVRWYEFTPTDDTVEFNKNILENLNDLF